MPSVLRKQLFDRLKASYGDVVVANPGESFIGAPNPMNGSRGGASRYVVAVPGEYYRIRCPFCNDTRKRLWINHTYYEHPWLAHCFNETSCLSEWANRERLHDEIFYGVTTVQVPDDAGSQSEPEDEVCAIALPGDVVTMDAVNPAHPTWKYLAGREFYPPDLARRYGVGVMTSSYPGPDGWAPPIEGRIFIPVIMYGEVVGWQTRFPGDLVWNQTGIRKYYNKPRMPRRRMLYGYDEAKRYRSLVLVEGCVDVWKIGPPACGLLGSSLTSQHINLIIHGWAGCPIAVYLDADATEANDGMVQHLREAQSVYGGVVFPVRPPDGLDPGALSPEQNWDLIDRSAAAAGVLMDRPR